MESQFLKLINRWMPRNQEAVRSWSRNERIRAMSYIFLNTAAIVLCAAFTVISILLTLSGLRDFSNAIIAGAISTVIALLILIYFVNTARLTASTTLFSTLFLVVCLVCVGVSGGPNSPLLPLLISAPIIASVTGGRGEGLYYTGLILLLFYLLVFLNSMGFTFIQIMPPENRDIQSGVTWTIALLLNATCLFVYQYCYEEGNKSPRSKN